MIFINSTHHNLIAYTYNGNTSHLAAYIQILFVNNRNVTGALWDWGIPNDLLLQYGVWKLTCCNIDILGGVPMGNMLSEFCGDPVCWVLCTGRLCDNPTGMEGGITPPPLIKGGTTLPPPPRSSFSSCSTVIDRCPLGGGMCVGCEWAEGRWCKTDAGGVWGCCIPLSISSRLSALCGTLDDGELPASTTEGLYMGKIKYRMLIYEKHWFM